MLDERQKPRRFPEVLYEQPLPVDDTLELFDHMPKGKWEIPQEPYTFWDKISENDLDDMKAYKRRGFRLYCQGLALEWIGFLKSADKGNQINRRFIEEHVLSADLDSIGSYILFNNLFTPKFYQGEELKFEDALSSVRNAFLYLLTAEQAKKIGYEKPKEVAQRDIENAKFMVNRLAGNL